MINECIVYKVVDVYWSDRSRTTNKLELAEAFAELQSQGSEKGKPFVLLVIRRDLIGLQDDTIVSMYYDGKRFEPANTED